MEPKKYQLEVIQDLNNYLEELNRPGATLSNSFERFWQNQGVDVNSVEATYVHPYCDVVTGAPNVTIKVPTAGGKTFLACKSLKPIFSHIGNGDPKVVVWFVPSDSILSQTLLNLKNPNHPYRHALNVDFGNRVVIVDKNEALAGNHIQPNEIVDNLTIFVMSVQSFATNHPDERLVRRENGNLAAYESQYAPNEQMITNADKTSLLQVLAHLHPVLIIDESHNFEANLRIDLLQQISPRFIYNLTATPREKSNIISFVDSRKLKDENMVKLPVIVYNHNTTDEVITNAITLQKNLESYAIEERKITGKYIRPIVLFQAQPRTNDDNVTYDNIKNTLLSVKIPADQIKIKTANVDELKGINLLDENCPVRFIITVNALKEGWDCPFAYILASLANKSSKIDVEQILGRILRLPYCSPTENELLGMSYVFTCSQNFQDTLDNIIKSLYKSGFSKRDYIAQDNSQSQEPTPPSTQPQQAKQRLFSTDDEDDCSEETSGAAEATTTVSNSSQASSSAANTSSVSAENNANSGLSEDKTSSENTEQNTDNKDQATPFNANTDQINSMLNSSETEKTVSKMEDIARQQNKAYLDQNKKTTNNKGTSQGKSVMAIKTDFDQEVQKIQLPIFTILAGYYPDGQERWIRLEKSHLLKGFDLSKEDTKIDFAGLQSEAEIVDINRDSVPIHKKLSGLQLSYVTQNILNLSLEGRRNQLRDSIVNLLDFDVIPDPKLKSYIEQCLSDQNDESIEKLIVHLTQTVKLFKLKIDGLLLQYRKKVFLQWQKNGIIHHDKTVSLPPVIEIQHKMVGLDKGLYEEEESVNRFEYRVLNVIANEDNVLFWHRNLERGKGFFINGHIHHYPDFIVRLKSGKTLLVETKGDDRDNSDSKEKNELGTIWSDLAGYDYTYFMVFENNKIDGAITVGELVQNIQQM